MEYDLSQAKSMNNALLFPMLMLWFLHFKMGQVQPIFFQTANGVKDFVFSPLFQVYGLGRNLERPFRNKRAEEMKKQQEALAGDTEDDVECSQEEDSSVSTETAAKEEEIADDDESDSDDDEESEGEDEDESIDEYDDEYDEEE